MFLVLPAHAKDVGEGAGVFACADVGFSDMPCSIRTHVFIAPGLVCDPFVQRKMLLLLLL